MKERTNQPPADLAAAGAAGAAGVAGSAGAAGAAEVAGMDAMAGVAGMAGMAGMAESAELGAQLRSAIARLYRRFRSERPEGGLGDAALAVLTRLHKHGPQTLTGLSDFDRVSPASMSQIVNRLTSAGYAVRSRDPDDGRKVRFSATEEGHRFAAAARAQRNAWLDERLRGLSDEDRAVIVRATMLLGDIADS